MCNIKAIRTEAQYEAALARIYALMDTEPGTPEGDEFELLADLVEFYEDRHYPIPEPDLHTSLECRLTDQGWTAQQLNAILGDGADIHEILAGRQAITIPMAKAMHEHLDISAEALFKALVLDAPTPEPAPAAD